MAMTKAESLRFAALENELALVRALRFTDYQCPVPLPMPLNTGEFINGWTFNVHSLSVTKAWTSRSFHGPGWRLGELRESQSASQGAIYLFASEADALLAMRIAKEREFAELLLRIDRRIADARKAPAAGESA